jgi:hypothetical protein
MLAALPSVDRTWSHLLSTPALPAVHSSKQYCERNAKLAERFLNPREHGCEMNQYLTGVLAVVLLAVIIYPQMRTMPVQPRQLVVFPAFLAIHGIINLLKAPPASSGVAAHL